MPKLLEFTPKSPFLVDWGFIGVEKTPESINQQYADWSMNIENDNQVAITSSVSIPSHLAHTFNIPEGSFYRYEGTSKYEVEEITPETISAIALEHFQKFPEIVNNDVMQKSNGAKQYNISLPSEEQLLNTAKNFLNS